MNKYVVIGMVLAGVLFIAGAVDAYINTECVPDLSKWQAGLQVLFGLIFMFAGAGGIVVYFLMTAFNQDTTGINPDELGMYFGGGAGGIGCGYMLISSSGLC